MEINDISLSNIINEQFNDTDYKYIEKKKIKMYCSNCGKYGHIYKKCKEPIISIGIINLFLTDLKLDTFFLNKYVIENIGEKYRQKHIFAKI